MSLWDKYMGQAPSWDTIYRDDFLPLARKYFKSGTEIDSALCDAYNCLSLQVPFGYVLPLNFVSRAKDAADWIDAEIIKEIKATPDLIYN